MILRMLNVLLRLLRPMGAFLLGEVVLAALPLGLPPPVVREEAQEEEVVLRVASDPGLVLVCRESSSSSVKQTVWVNSFSSWGSYFYFIGAHCACLLSRYLQ